MTNDPDGRQAKRGTHASGEMFHRTECQPTLSIAEIRKRAEKRAGETAKADPRALANFSSRINLATAAGAKVKRIVVQRWSPHGWGNYPAWSDVLKEIQTVWAGRIEAMYPTADGISAWSERSVWNVFATIEFDNSSERGCPVTDGLHISMRDVKGEIWLTRLMPTQKR